MDVLLTTGQLANAIGVSVSTACRLANQGMPHSLTPGGKKRWSLDDARAWLEDRMIECEHEAEDDEDLDEEEDLDDEEDLDEGSGDETEVDEEDGDGYDPHDVEDEDPEDDLDDEEGDDEPCPTCGASAEDEEDDDGEDE